MKHGIKSVLAIICLVAVVFSFAGCEFSKTALDVQGFTDIMTAEGFKVIPSENGADSPIITSSTVAEGEDFQVEFYTVNSKSNTEFLFESNCEEIELSGVGSYTGKGGSNYSTLSGTYGDTYYYMAYVDATLVYIAADVSQKDAVGAIVEKLGY